MPHHSNTPTTPTRNQPSPWIQRYHQKVITPEHLPDAVHALRQAGKTIATLNGSFDLLHAGHLHILYEAAQHGDALIVALNSDSSIQQYKSPDRPIITLEYRLQMIAAIECVDFVTWFDETDPKQVLTTIKPDVHVNGAEYGTDCIEAETVKTNGGTVHVVELVPGLSTTEIINTIQKLPGAR